MTKNKKFKTIESAEVLWKNNVSKEKSEICLEFLTYLTNIVEKHFLGFDSLKSETDINNYLLWCFNKTCDYFNDIYNINFMENENVKIYSINHSNTLLLNLHKENFMTTLFSFLKIELNIYKARENTQILEYMNIYLKFFP